MNKLIAALVFVGFISFVMVCGASIYGSGFPWDEAKAAEGSVIMRYAAYVLYADISVAVALLCMQLAKKD